MVVAKSTRSTASLASNESKARRNTSSHGDFAADSNKKVDDDDHITGHRNQHQLVSDILSRSTIYTPLKAYEQTVVEPSDYLKQCRNIPKSIHEQSIPDFYQDISIHFHHYQQQKKSLSGGLDGKNTSAKPLTKQDVSKQMESRALTLVGGGFNAASPSVINKNSTMPITLSAITTGADCLGNNKTKKAISIPGILLKQHIKRTKRKRILQSCHKTEETAELECFNKTRMVPTVSTELIQKNSNFVRVLNSKWNDYARNIISMLVQQEGNSKLAKNKKKQQKMNQNSNNLESELIQDLLSSPLNRSYLDNYLEWVGSQVKIQECIAQRGYENKTGVLIASTVETWTIFVEDDKMNGNNAFATLARKSCTQRSLLIVPKKGTSLVVLLPIGNPSINNVKSDETVVDHLSKTSPDSTAKVLCIVLKDCNGS